MPIKQEINMKDNQNKPNIIFFFSDQQRWDTIGAYGQKLPVTPNLDKMAGEGVIFNNAFTCQPVCGPARACLQIGKYAAEIGCFRNNKLLPLNEKTIAHYFSENGYETAYIGKWHLASDGEKGINYRTEPVPEKYRGGWKDFWLASDVLEFTSHSYDGHMFDMNGNKKTFPEGRFRVDAQTDWAIEYLQNRKTDNPFFLFLSYIEPHHQNDHNRYEGPKGSKEKFKDYIVPGDLEDKDGDWKENYPDYLGCCNSLDGNPGRIIDELEKQDILDTTLIIYTSDHGSHFHTRKGEYKRACHDACTHIPLVIKGPGFKGGKKIENLTSLIDVVPTFLKAGDIDIPDYMQGRALQDLAKGGDAENWPEEVFIQISEAQVGRAIRTNKWKYSVHAPDKDGGKDSGSKVYIEQFLYDLENDPWENNNLVLAPAYADVRKELAERLKTRMKQANEEIPEIKPAVE